MARLFISQERLDAWSAEQRVQLDGDILTLAEDGRAFRIRPAVRFLKVATDEPDAADLLDTVQDDEDLARLGADQYMDSVILGDTAYDVQPGFLGDPLARPAGGG
jgi:hypothetical protein